MIFGLRTDIYFFAFSPLSGSILRIFFISVIFLLPSFSQAIEPKSELNSILPPPSSVDLSIDKAMQHRTSIREFTNESVSDEDLSTILWAAYGLREDGNRTVPPIEGKQ